MNGQIPAWAADYGATQQGLDSYRRRRAGGAALGEDPMTYNGQPVGGMRPNLPDQGVDQYLNGQPPSALNGGLTSSTPDQGQNQVDGGRTRIRGGGRGGQTDRNRAGRRPPPQAPGSGPISRDGTRPMGPAMSSDTGGTRFDPSGGRGGITRFPGQGGPWQDGQRDPITGHRMFMDPNSPGAPGMGPMGPGKLQAPGDGVSMGMGNGMPSGRSGEIGAPTGYQTGGSAPPKPGQGQPPQVNVAPTPAAPRAPRDYSRHLYDRGSTVRRDAVPPTPQTGGEMPDSPPGHPGPLGGPVYEDQPAEIPNPHPGPLGGPTQDPTARRPGGGPVFGGSGPLQPDPNLMRDQLMKNSRRRPPVGNGGPIIPQRQF